MVAEKPPKTKKKQKKGKTFFFFLQKKSLISGKFFQKINIFLSFCQRNQNQMKHKKTQDKISNICNLVTTMSVSKTKPNWIKSEKAEITPYTCGFCKQSSLGRVFLLSSSQEKQPRKRDFVKGKIEKSEKVNVSSLLI